MQTLLSNSHLQEAITTTNGAAGSTDINGATVNMKGYEGIVAHVKFGTIGNNAVTKVKMQESTIATGANSDWTDIEGAELTVAATDDDTYKSIEVANVRKHHARVVVERATANATVLAAFYQKCNPSFAPTQHSEAFATKIVTPS